MLVSSSAFCGSSNRGNPQTSKVTKKMLTAMQYLKPWNYNQTWCSWSDFDLWYFEMILTNECKMSPPYRCPPVKTVPYTCAPGATDTSQCIYGEVQINQLLIQYNSAQGSYHGTFSLLDEASSHCPKAMGYTGLENTNLGGPSSILVHLIRFLGRS